MDLLREARESVVNEWVAAVERPPKDFSKPYNVKSGLIGASVLGGTGLALGSHAGIAMFGTAISGAWVLAPVLALAGFAISQRRDRE